VSIGSKEKEVNQEKPFCEKEMLIHSSHAVSCTQKQQREHKDDNYA
jgi:hypothetical protein